MSFSSYGAVSKERAGRGTYLSLHVCDLVERERVLVQRHLGDLEEAEEAELAREQEQQTATSLASSCRTSDAVDVVARVIRRVELDDPVDLGDVESTRSHVRAEEDARGRVAELEEGVGALLLLLLPLRSRQRRIKGQADVRGGQGQARRRSSAARRGTAPTCSWRRRQSPSS